VPEIRADIIDAYIFRRSTPEDDTGSSQPRPVSGGVELLQLRRARDPLSATWQPVMGHVEAGETAVACLWRELAEEVGLRARDAVGAWALEQVHPFFLAQLDAVVMSPRFAVEVESGWSPLLNKEHDDHRWVPAGEAGERFLWPGQHAAIAELRGLLDRAWRAAHLRLEIPC
jgi:8-oxo-dGTP pyrophosphatase MutT (NUDIX family)